MFGSLDMPSFISTNSLNIHCYLLTLTVLTLTVFGIESCDTTLINCLLTASGKQIAQKSELRIQDFLQLICMKLDNITAYSVVALTCLWR